MESPLKLTEKKEKCELDHKIHPIYKEIFFIENGSQSNVYCSTKLRYPSTSQERFLVGTLKGKVSCLERLDIVGAEKKFHSSHDMQAREVYFSYIPGAAELISMDAFYHTNRNNKFLVVGLTLILLKAESNDVWNEPKCYFNIYNALEPGEEFDLDKLAQVCQHQALNFIPFHLHHGMIYVDGMYEMCFLLSGSDCKIHLFRGNSQLKFDEHPCKDFFPEFLHIPGRVFWMDVRNCDDFKRVTAFGCDNGWLQVSVVDVKTNVILKNYSLKIEGPISSVCLFTFNAIRAASFTKHSNNPNSPIQHVTKSDQLNLLVTSALDVSAVYLYVENSGFDIQLLLNQSDQFDSITCSCVTDVDCDGNNEIILGTYGQELLVYKWYNPSNGVTNNPHFELSWQRQFSKPLLSVNSLDMMGDGMQEIVVVSLTGVHILQYKIDQAADILVTKIVEHFPKEENEKNENKSENVSNELDAIIEALSSTNNSYNELPKT